MVTVILPRDFNKKSCIYCLSKSVSFHTPRVLQNLPSPGGVKLLPHRVLLGPGMPQCVCLPGAHGIWGPHCDEVCLQVVGEAGRPDVAPAAPRFYISGLSPAQRLAWVSPRCRPPPRGAGLNSGCERASDSRAPGKFWNRPGL